LVEIETHKARDATIRSQVKWKNVGDKCSTKFSALLDPKRNVKANISKLKDKAWTMFYLTRGCRHNFVTTFIKVFISINTI
jgi:hypothetical protein